MDPISLSFMAISLATTGLGMFDKMKGASAQTAAQEQMIGVERQENSLRNQIMHLTANREQMQNLRNVQRARSLATSNAVSSGAQFGSGLQGGLEQVGGAGNTNALNLSQDVQGGDTMFGLSNEMSAAKIAYAQAGGDINTGTGLMQLGQTIGQYNSQLTGLTKQGIGALTPNAFPSKGYYG